MAHSLISRRLVGQDDNLAARRSTKCSYNSFPVSPLRGGLASTPTKLPEQNLQP